jgi:uncharacterized damage-inducible protein DinB
MNVSDLERLYDYHYWATSKLLGVAGQLTPDEFTQPVAGSYRSVRNTLVHILSAEWGWLDRCGGPRRGERLKAENFPTLESVVETWNRVEVSMRTFLSNLTELDLAREVEFSFGGPKHSLPVADLLQHTANHGVHHRGQVALMLRELGHVPGDFDYLYFASKVRDAVRA